MALPVGLERLERADNGPRTRDLHHGEVALFLLSYIRVEPSAGFAPAPSSLPRKRPDSGTARASAGRPGFEPGIVPGSRPGGSATSPTAQLGASGPARTGCLPFTRRPLYLVSYEGIVSSVRFERTLASPSCWCLLPIGLRGHRSRRPVPIRTARLTRARPQPCAAARLPGLDSNQRGQGSGPCWGLPTPHPEPVRAERFELSHGRV